jgi:putative transposase
MRSFAVRSMKRAPAKGQKPICNCATDRFSRNHSDRDPRRRQIDTEFPSTKFRGNLQSRSIGRHSIRLKGYDYAQEGAYFITITTQNRACLFGDIIDSIPRLNDAGRMIESVWVDMPTYYPGVEADTFIVMPNHIHGIVLLVGAGPRACPNDTGQPQGVAPTMSLADIIHRFKTLTTKRYIDGVKQASWMPFAGRFWQRNYYEHIIRDEKSLLRIREYIATNPARWSIDPENPFATRPESKDIWRTVGAQHAAPLPVTAK